MNRKINTFIMVTLTITVIIMSVGYAALARQLTITGTASTGDATWNISFLSITKNTSLTTSTAIENSEPTAVGTAATFDVTLNEPGATIVYDLIVQNTGSIDATFVETSGLKEINEDEPTQIEYSIERLNPDNDSILSGSGDLLHGTTNKFRVTIKWPSTSTSVPSTITSKTGTIYLDYVQKTT